jgi:hypothetical protein
MSTSFVTVEMKLELAWLSRAMGPKESLGRTHQREHQPRTRE